MWDLAGEIVSLGAGDKALHAECAADGGGGEVVVVLKGFGGEGECADGAGGAERGGEGLAGDGVVPNLGSVFGIGEVLLGKECSGGALAVEEFVGDCVGVAVGVEGLGDLVGDGVAAGNAGGFFLDVDEGVVGGGAGGAAEGDVGERGFGIGIQKGARLMIMPPLSSRIIS